MRMYRMIRKLLLLSVFILVFGFFGLIKVNSVNAQACTAPATATGVTVEYPGCNGTQCDLAQASCSWNSQGDASSYNVTVTEVESNTVIKNNESVSASTTKVLFAITQKKTYKCDVVAVHANAAVMQLKRVNCSPSFSSLRCQPR